MTDSDDEGFVCLKAYKPHKSNAENGHTKLLTLEIRKMLCHTVKGCDENAVCIKRFGGTCRNVCCTRWIED